MTVSTYIMCFLAGLLGMLFHIFAIQMPAVKTRAVTANMQFSIRGYFKDEAAAIIANLLTILILLVVLKELVAFKPEVLPYITAGFVFVGYSGSSVLISLLGKAQAKINTVVNIKTDISDKVAPDIPPDQKI